VNYRYWLVFTVFLVACGGESQDSEGQTKLLTMLDRSSYAVGVSFGERLQLAGLMVDDELVHQGLNDVIKGRDLLLSEEERLVLDRQIQVERETLAELSFDALENKNMLQGAEALAQNSKTEGVEILASGLQLMMLAEGEGVKPSIEDTVTIQYQASKLDGDVFDSTYLRGKPVQIVVSELLPGLSQAIQLVGVGGKMKLLVPPEIAYQQGSVDGLVGPGETVRFEVDLLSIEMFK
jgi:FKBP-type peptidyl-prolyl cis-trans isomerase